MKPFLITCNNNVVLDSNGYPLLSTNSYTMSSGLLIAGGIGLRGNHIVQKAEAHHGSDAYFIPNLNNSGVVHESSNILIKFVGYGDIKPKIWQVNTKDEKTGNYYLTVGEHKLKDQWFQIMKSDDTQNHSYKIMYCNEQICNHVGLDRVRLVVSDMPLTIQFYKA
ncbi:hypothetical protein ACFE04_007859 [Oxalis oulophora]